VVSDEADGRTRTEADSRCTHLCRQQNRLLWSPSLPACLQTAYEALPERRLFTWSGRRGSNPRQPAWKADGHRIAASFLQNGSGSAFIHFNCDPRTSEADSRPHFEADGYGSVYRKKYTSRLLRI